MSSRPICLGALAVVAGLFIGYAGSSANQNPAVQSSKEDAYRANNIGVAFLEQFNFKEAAAEFRRALKIQPSLAIARVNLAIALYNQPDADGALVEIKAAATLLPSLPQIHYLLGLIARTQNRIPEAIAEFQKVLQVDPNDPSTNINLGQLFMQQRKYPEAIALLRSAIASEPYSVTATYNLAIALTRSGDSQEGQAMMKRFQTLRAKPYSTTLGKDYLEQGQYAIAVSSTGAEADLVDAARPNVTFVDATSKILPPPADPQSKAAVRSPIGQAVKAADLAESQKRQFLESLSGGAMLVDFDGDGDLDVVNVTARGLRLLRNDNGKFVDLTEQSGFPQSSSSVSIAAVSGDYDNDGTPDVLVLASSGLALFHGNKNGKFSDVTAAAAIPRYPYTALSAAFVDVDHDGDLDIFVAGFVDLSRSIAGDANRTMIFPNDFPGAPNLLLRNDGNGKFTDITAEAKLSGTLGHAIAVVPTDYDNHRDIDLLVVNRGATPNLFSNQRDGSFKDVAAEAGLNIKGEFTCVAAGDVNKDDFTDFFFSRDDGPGLFALSDGKGRFVVSPAPAGSEGAVAAQFLDYDNDGLIDVVLLRNQGPLVLRNLASKWDDVTERAVSADLVKTFQNSGATSVRGLASGDVDGDGDTDLVAVLSAGDLRLARNEGATQNRSLKVQLTSRVSNRSAAGAKIELRAGSLKQKLEIYAATPAPAPADIVFGLAHRGVADALRILWPAGIVQAETELSSATASGPLASTIKIMELDRKPSSCPFLYAWNGSRFEFVSDFMGGGEMGYWEAPGLRNHPDPNEYVRIRSDQLKPRNGLFELRMTNELEEVVYADRIQLIAVEHPADTEVYPNEGMTDPPRLFRLFTTRHAAPPIAAVDDHGNDVLPRIAELDRQYPDDFALQKIRGYAEMHSLTLNLGAPSKSRTLLLLTGWTDYAFSSDNVAAHQSGLSMIPPRLEVKDANGKWREAIADIGIPVGRPQTIVLDLSGVFATKNREVRIVTNMRIYWDQILVDTSSGNLPVRMTRLDPVVADLHWRGFSAEVSPDGREPLIYDYNRVSLVSPWKTMIGRYTREGDVRGLLRRSDDMFVVSKPGDEIALSFDAKGLPPVAAGWTRTFLLYADGFSKEMDINSASPDQVEPLPFHAMKKYPESSYPAPRERMRYIDRYNTRLVASPVPKIETAFGFKNH